MGTRFANCIECDRPWADDMLLNGVCPKCRKEKRDYGYDIPDIPETIKINGVKGILIKEGRYYSSIEEKFVIDITYRFSIKELSESSNPSKR